MKIGIKYCGGCNPRYNRQKAFRTLRDNLRGRFQFEFVKNDGNLYDIIVIIAGCSSNCVDYNLLNGKILYQVTSQDEVWEVLQKLKRLPI